MAPQMERVDGLPHDAEELFDRACAYATAMRSRLSIPERLRLYALFKQARCGDAPASTAAWSSVVDRAKHQVWASRRGMSASEAKEQYVACVNAILSNAWLLSSPPHAAPPAPVASDAEALRERIAVLQKQLAALTCGDTKRGWLFKWAPHSGSWLQPSGRSRWQRRFFLLRERQLSYFNTEATKDARPRRVIELYNCVVVDEGSKRSGGRTFYLFSLWTHGTLESARGPGSGALLRVSCGEQQEALEWIHALRAASARESGRHSVRDEPEPAAVSQSEGLRQRKGAAVATAEVAKKVMKKQLDPFLFPASRPMHRVAQPSLLSGELAERPEMSGFINLVFIIFFATNARLLVENLSKYGVLVEMPAIHSVAPHASAPLLALASIGVPLLGAWLIERCAIGTRTMYLTDVLHAANAGGGLLAACALVHLDAGGGGSVGGVALLLASITLFMKLCSWAHVHHDLRMANRESSLSGSDLDEQLAKFETSVADADGGGRVHYPQNVTLRGILYFAFAPTLCYQVAFPRSPRVRWTYLFSLLVRLIILSAFIPAFIAQYMMPLLKNSAAPVREGDLLGILERMLKLAIPTTCVWLSGFYLFFHVWLNVLAELLRFGDRQFYKAWWNANDFEQYWRLWNIPVHNFIVRHIYFPILRHVTSNKSLNGLLCFTLSAVLHEVVIALPLHTYRMPLAFLGMMAQVPMLFISGKISRATKDTAFSQLGNYIFWISFCFFGQPAAVLLYFNFS